MVVLSVALLLAALVFTTLAGAVALTVFTICPFESGFTLACSVICTKLPLATVTRVWSGPLPAARQLEPADAKHVHPVPIRPAGRLSLTMTPVAIDGPVLLIRMV